MFGLPVDTSDLVFAHPDGSPLLPHTITNVWKRVVKQTGFQGICLHDARHSHATLMPKQGVNPKIVSERLGHASVVTTLDTYSHVLPGIQEAAARAFDKRRGGGAADNRAPTPLMLMDYPGLGAFNPSVLSQESYDKSGRWR